MSPSPIVRMTGLSLALSASLLTVSAQAAIVSFAGARDSGMPQAAFDAGNYVYTESVATSGTAPVSATIPGGPAGAPLVNATARTEYGANRVLAASNAPVSDEGLRQTSIGGPFSAAVSLWADTFTITGGTGTGTASISAVLTGQFGSNPQSTASGLYFLGVVNSSFVGDLSAKPLEFAGALFDTAAPGASLGVGEQLLRLQQNVNFGNRFEPGQDLAPGSAFGGVLTGTLTFTYGQPFTLASLLVAAASDFGSLDALNTALFGITPLDDGAVLTSASQTAWAPAFVREQPGGAVPLPSSLALLIGALASLVGARRMMGGLRG